MTRLAPTLQTYFTTRLTSQFGASPHTLIAYRDTWRLLLRFIADTTSTPPQDLQLSALTAGVISDFLNYLETVRGNAISTRNARLAALHSFFTYAAYRHPEHAATISQIMAIPSKRHHRTDLTYLTPPEVTALLAANGEQIRLYHDIGREILDRQSRQGWGAKVIDRLSADLRAEFPDMKGLSASNLKYMRYFASECPDRVIGQQSADQLPRFHIVTLITKLHDPALREWYAREAVAQSWPRDTLNIQIKNQLHLRKGAAVTDRKSVV